MQFEHKVEKATIPTVRILGVDIAAIDMEWLLKFIEENVYKLSGDYICVSNVHTSVMAYEDVHYQDIQNGGILAIPDGGPLSSVGIKRGAINMHRTTGPSFMEEIMKVSVVKGYRHFFYGSSQSTLDQMRRKIETDYPGLEIAGMYSPPFRPLTEDEDRNIITLINAVHPDFLWVGLGAPKQEKWMAAHQGCVEGLMVGVGAAFDYYAGNIKRAPSWMQNANLEWVYRLLQDPKRLFKRYFFSNTKFIWNAVIRRK